METTLKFKQCQSLRSGSWGKAGLFLQWHFYYQRGWSVTESDIGW
jgi:hypothetical protein